MSILYRYGSTYYINMTNRCPCRCVFCVRDSTPRLGDADSLWLDHEPTVDEVMRELRAVDLSKSREVVFWTPTAWGTSSTAGTSCLRWRV